MAKKLMSDLDRMLSKVSVTEDGLCWNWIGTLDRDGYARLARIGSRTDGSRGAVRPYRFIYEELRGPIPDGLQMDHLCRNRRCCNPWHLEPVTQSENTRRGARATKTHCPLGHPYSGENLIRHKTGRRCRTCANAATRRHEQKTGNAASARYRQRKREEAQSWGRGTG